MGRITGVVRSQGSTFPVTASIRPSPIGGFFLGVGGVTVSRLTGKRRPRIVLAVETPAKRQTKPENWRRLLR
jgi:hypothetical protein